MSTIKDNKGFWEYSIFQKIIIPNEEQNIKISLKPENSFNPLLIHNYINPQLTKQETIFNKVNNAKKNPIKLNNSDKIKLKYRDHLVFFFFFFKNKSKPSSETITVLLAWLAVFCIFCFKKCFILNLKCIWNPHHHVISCFDFVLYSFERI